MKNSLDFSVIYASALQGVWLAVEPDELLAQDMTAAAGSHPVEEVPPPAGGRSTGRFANADQLVGLLHLRRGDWCGPSDPRHHCSVISRLWWLIDHECKQRKAKVMTVYGYQRTGDGLPRSPLQAGDIVCITGIDPHSAFPTPFVHRSSVAGAAAADR